MQQQVSELFTLNHQKAVEKLFYVTKYSRPASLVKTLLQNRNFNVTLQGKRAERWRDQRNGIAQEESVLAPMLFNVYTNNHPTDNGIYADDTTMAVQVD